MANQQRVVDVRKLFRLLQVAGFLADSYPRPDLKECSRLEARITDVPGWVTVSSNCEVIALDVKGVNGLLDECLPQFYRQMKGLQRSPLSFAEIKLRAGRYLISDPNCILGPNARSETPPPPPQLPPPLPMQWPVQPQPFQPMASEFLKFVVQQVQQAVAQAVPTPQVPTAVQPNPIPTFLPPRAPSVSSNRAQPLSQRPIEESLQTLQQQATAEEMEVEEETPGASSTERELGALALSSASSVTITPTRRLIVKLKTNTTTKEAEHDTIKSTLTSTPVQGKKSSASWHRKTKRQKSITQGEEPEARTEQSGREQRAAAKEATKRLSQSSSQKQSPDKAKKTTRKKSKGDSTKGKQKPKKATPPVPGDTPTPEVPEVPEKESDSSTEWEPSDDGSE